MKRTTECTDIEAVANVMEVWNAPRLRSLATGLKCLETNYRDAYKKMDFNKNGGESILEACYTLATSGYIYNDEIVFAADMNTIRKTIPVEFRRNENSFTKTLRKILFHRGFIRLLPEDELMDNLPAMYNQLMKNRKKKRGHHCNVYAVPFKRSLEECIDICLNNIEQRKNDGGSGPITKDGTRLLGKDVCEELYQRSDQGISDNMSSCLSDFRAAIKNARERGFVTEKEIATFNNKKCPKALEEWRRGKLKEALPRLLKDYDIERITVNENTRKQFNIPGEIKSKSKVIVWKAGQEKSEGVPVECQSSTETGTAIEKTPVQDIGVPIQVCADCASRADKEETCGTGSMGQAAEQYTETNTELYPNNQAIGCP